MNSDSAPVSLGPDRRKFLRGSVLAGFGLVAVGIGSAALEGRAQAATSIQTGWAWCSKCQGLFYGPKQSSSVCPAGGTHNGAGSDDYELSYTT
jgi:hypothetical protein